VPYPWHRVIDRTGVSCTGASQQVCFPLRMQARTHLDRTWDAEAVRTRRFLADDGVRWLLRFLANQSIIPAQRPDPSKTKKRPQQDSNLRSRLRRARPQNPLTNGGTDLRGQLGRVWGVAAVGPVLSGWRRPGPDLGGEALPGLTSGWLALRVDAVLTEQGAEPLELVGELLASLGQLRQRRVPAGPLLSPRGLVGQQLLLPVAQRGGLIEVLGIDGRLLLGAGCLDLLVQVTGVGSDPDPLLNGRQPLLDRLQANLRSRPRLLSRVPVQQLDDLLAHPVQVSAQPDQHLRGHAVVLADEAEQDVLGADVVVAELQRLTQRKLEHLLGPGRERDVPLQRFLAPADDLLDLLPHGIQADAERLKRLGRDTFALAEEAEQDVLGADVVVLKPPGFFLSQDHNPPGPVGKPLEHRLPPRATEQNLAARPEHRPNGTCPGKPVMTHPHYASAEVRRDRKAARWPGPSLAVDQVTGGPLVLLDPRQEEEGTRV
jgi:hypothetical protein